MQENHSVPFEELFSAPLRNGLTRPKAVRGSGTKMINMGELFAFSRIQNVHADRVPFSEKEESYLLEDGDLLFARQSLVLSGAGKCSIFMGDREPVTYEGHIIRARLNKKIANPLFYYYFFNSPVGRRAIEGIVEQVAAAGVRGSDLAKLPVPHMPIPKQTAIARILGALDDKIELNRRMNRTLESIARAVFRRWFVESDHTESWKESSLVELFGRKSDCVLTGPFGSHLHAHDYRDEGTPLILVKHVMDGHILEDGLPLVGDHKLSEMQRYLLEVGDIVFTRVGAVGRSAFVHPRNKGWMISGQTLRVRVPDKTKLSPRYLAQIYLEPSFMDMVGQHALGTTRPSLNTSILLSFKFRVPPIELQNDFGVFADAIDKKVQQNKDESRTLASLRDSLLPKLMRGEVRVNA